MSSSTQAVYSPNNRIVGWASSNQDGGHGHSPPQHQTLQPQSMSFASLPPAQGSNLIVSASPLSFFEMSENGDPRDLFDKTATMLREWQIGGDMKQGSVAEAASQYLGRAASSFLIKGDSISAADCWRALAELRLLQGLPHDAQRFLHQAFGQYQSCSSSSLSHFDSTSFFNPPPGIKEETNSDQEMNAKRRRVELGVGHCHFMNAEVHLQVLASMMEPTEPWMSPTAIAVPINANSALWLQSPQSQPAPLPTSGVFSDSLAPVSKMPIFVVHLPQNVLVSIHIFKMA